LWMISIQISVSWKLSMKSMIREIH